MGWSAVPAPPHLMLQKDVMLADTVDKHVCVCVDVWGSTSNWDAAMTIAARLAYSTSWGGHMIAKR